MNSKITPLMALAALSADQLIIASTFEEAIEIVFDDFDKRLQYNEMTGEDFNRLYASYKLTEAGHSKQSVSDFEAAYQKNCDALISVYPFRRQ